jgi:hypothetical protein
MKDPPCNSAPHKEKNAGKTTYRLFGVKHIAIFMIGFWLAKLDTRYGTDFGFWLGMTIRRWLIP